MFHLDMAEKKSTVDLPVENQEDQATKPLRIEFDDNQLVMELCGHHDKNLQQIEDTIGVQIVTRGNQVAIFGDEGEAEKVKIVLEDLYELLESGMTVGASQVDAALRVSDGLIQERMRPNDVMGEKSVIKTPFKKVAPRSMQQHVYVGALQHAHLVFGLGSAGSGKTYLATAMAVHMLTSKKVKKIILTRPVVEAGESLGFLPGTLEEKIDPYLRPFFDALHEMLGLERTKELMEQQVIEIAPLAYMRGRTLSDAVMILDEAQNATTMQIKMFLTRMGENSRMIVTGDPSQTDLKRGQKSGLNDAVAILEGLKDIEVVRFGDADVVRHQLVSRIVRAYDEKERQIDMKLDEKKSS